MMDGRLELSDPEDEAKLDAGDESNRNLRIVARVSASDLSIAFWALNLCESGSQSSTSAIRMSSPEHAESRVDSNPRESVQASLLKDPLYLARVSFTS